MNFIFLVMRVILHPVQYVLFGFNCYLCNTMADRAFCVFVIDCMMTFRLHGQTLVTLNVSASEQC